MKGKKIVKNENVKAFTGGIKQGFKDMSTGAKAAVVPGVLAGAVAGRASSNKKIEKKASVKGLVGKARKAKSYIASKGHAALDKFDNAAGADPMRRISLAQGAAIGGGAAYVGQKKITQDSRSKKAKK